MSNAGTAIDAIQQELAKPEWDGGTIERVNEILIKHGFNEHVSDKVFSNKFLRAQLVSELTDALRECLTFWEDQLGFDVFDYTYVGFATSIVRSLEDIHNTLPPESQS